jgi:hypothetical protein
MLASLPAVNVSTQWAAMAKDRRITETRAQVISDMERARHHGEASAMSALMATALADDSYAARHRASAAQWRAVLAGAQRLTADAPAGRDVTAAVQAAGELAALERTALDELAAGRPGQGCAAAVTRRAPSGGEGHPAAARGEEQRQARAEQQHGPGGDAADGHTGERQPAAAALG